MRIKVLGNNLATKTLIGYIHRLGYAVVDSFPTWTIELAEYGEDFHIDGVDSELERRILYHLEDLGAERFILQRGGGIRKEDAIKICYPKGKDEIVARAIARVVQEIKPKRFWAKKLFLIGLLLLPTQVQAQQFVYGRAWDSVNLLGVDPGDSANKALRVNCVTGCGAGSGATGIQVRSGGGTWTDVGFAGGNLTVPVSGTFWQTTQPVSWSSQTVTVTQGTGTNLHTVLDSGTLTSITNTISSNLAQVGGNTVATDIGDRSNATQRVLHAGIPTVAMGQITCANTATQITTARAGRQGIAVTNLGTVDVYIGTSGVTTSNGDLLLGLKGASASYTTSATIYCIVASGTQVITYAEVY
jgi:hypothetical protein